MKKYNKIAYIVLILISLLSGIFVYKVSGKNSPSEDLEEKTLSEVKHLESQFQSLFNQLNNISFDKYKVSSSEIEQKENKNQSSESSSSPSTNGGSSSEKSGNSEGSGNSKSSEESSESSNNKQYKLEEVGILTKDSEINWNQIKNDVEKIYISIYPMTLDLYQTSTDQQDIVNFNKEYDNLTKTVKDENKENTLIELSILYDYLPKFVDNCTDNEKEKTIIKTKNNIFKAYSILEKEQWSDISNNINNATQEFTKLITNIKNKENENEYNINKTYVMINELQNAVTLKDKEVFLIKYKNLLEEIQNV